MADLNVLFRKYDINASGKIEYEEVQRATQDWLQNKISTQELIQIQRWWLGKDQPPAPPKQEQKTDVGIISDPEVQKALQKWGNFQVGIPEVKLPPQRIPPQKPTQTVQQQPTQPSKQESAQQSKQATDLLKSYTVTVYGEPSAYGPVAQAELDVSKIRSDFLAGKLSSEDVKALFSTEVGRFTQKTWQSDPFIQAVISGKLEEYKTTEQLKQFVGVDFWGAAEKIQKEGFPSFWRQEWTQEFQKFGGKDLAWFLAYKTGRTEDYYKMLTQRTLMEKRPEQMWQQEVEKLKQIAEQEKQRREAIYKWGSSEDVPQWQKDLQEQTKKITQLTQPIPSQQQPTQTQQAQQQFSKEEIDKIVRQMVAKGMKPEDIQNELRKLGIGADIVKAEIQSPFKPIEQQTQTQAEQAKEQTPQTAKMDILGDLGKVADSVVKGTIGAIETVTRPITDKITDILWSDVKQRFADTPILQGLELETKGEKPTLSQLLGAYISPIETASKGFEEKGNVVAAGVTGFTAGALTMITAPVGIAEHVAEKGKEGGLAGLGEAVKDVALGTVEWAVSIPGRVATGSPSEIGKVAGEVMGGVVGGKLMEAPLKVPGKVYGEARFWGKEYVPFEKLAHPDVASGKTEFTPVSIVEKGKYVKQATPQEAVQATIKQFYESPLKESLEIGQKYPAVGGHGSPMAVEMGKQGTLEVKQGKPRLWDVAGLYISGGLMEFFLKAKEYTSTLNPVEAIKSTVQTIKEEGVTGFIKEEIKHTFGLPGKEGFVAVGMKGVKEVPKEFAEKGLGGYKEFFEKGPIEPGYAYIEPKTGILRQTWEHQAVIPKGALLENIHGKGFEVYTKVKIGEKEVKVPIYEMAYERVAEWRLPEAMKEARKAEEAPKGEVKPYEQALKEYGFKERVEYEGPRVVSAPPATAFARPESGEKAVKMSEEMIRMTSEFREPKEAFRLPKEFTEGIRVPEMEKIGREVVGIRPKETPRSPIVEIPEITTPRHETRTPKTPIYEIPEIIEPRMPRRGREPMFGIPEIPEIVEPITRQSPSQYTAPPPAQYISAPAPSYEPVLDIGAIYGPIARGKGPSFGGIEEMTRLVMYQEGRKREEPYKVPDIDLEFFKKFNPVGELLGGRFRL